jgi:hypothetical protein
VWTPALPFSCGRAVISGSGETAPGSLPPPALGTEAVIDIFHVSLELSYRLPDTSPGLRKILDQ